MVGIGRRISTTRLPTCFISGIRIGIRNSIKCIMSTLYTDGMNLNASVVLDGAVTQAIDVAFYVYDFCMCDIISSSNSIRSLTI